MKLKICGLMSVEDVECVNRAGVDYAGFVFTPHRQQISVEVARVLKASLNPEIKAVGVFVNEPFEVVQALVAEGVIDVVQFHGDVEYALPCPTIRAFRMRSESDIRPTNCDFVLFDSFGGGGGSVGSTGKTFDWRLTDSYRASPPDSRRPFFLAGGIDASNIRAAMSLNPYCIDISSGVEEGGKKSAAKVTEIANIVKYCKGGI
jgi:phosphoribosylanthranilate isomerase